MLANLLALEKKTRLAADAKSTVVVCQAILQACWDVNDWAALNANLSILTKRRAQLQKAVEAVIQLGAKFVKQVDASTPEGETRQRELIETLRTVSAGKMFVELERAQLTAILAAHEEKAGKVREAADILQEIQVETIGSMDVQEKANYLLEQVRLVLAKRDYVRTEIIAKKLAVKQFNEPEAKTNPKWQEIKIKVSSAGARQRARCVCSGKIGCSLPVALPLSFFVFLSQYYKLMIEYHHHYAHYYEIAKSYREVCFGSAYRGCCCAASFFVTAAARSLHLSFVCCLLLPPPRKDFQHCCGSSRPRAVEGCAIEAGDLRNPIAVGCGTERHAAQD